MGSAPGIGFVTGATLSPLVLLLWGSSVLFDSGGQLAFKAAAVDARTSKGLARWRRMGVRPWIWVGVACYGFEIGLWLALLSVVPLSEGILLRSINIAAVMLAGHWLFGERLSRMRVAGIVLISTGVAVVGWS